VVGHSARRRAQRARSLGFTYVWVLVAIAVLGVGLLAASEVWVTSAKRQKMVELEWIGAQFTSAIGNYYQATPGLVKSYPTSLQELLEDRRYATVRRHLRSLYPNPFTGQQDWEFLRSADGRIRGVRAVVRTDSAEQSFDFVYQPGMTGR
jgi:type II secretory pathway pseudopilin PulG